MHLVSWVVAVALSGDAEADALVPFHEGRNGGPRHMLWHSAPGTLMCLHIELTRIYFIENI